MLAQLTNYIAISHAETPHLSCKDLILHSRGGDPRLPWPTLQHRGTGFSSALHYFDSCKARTPFWLYDAEGKISLTDPNDIDRSMKTVKGCGEGKAETETQRVFFFFSRPVYIWIPELLRHRVWLWRSSAPHRCAPDKQIGEHGHFSLRWSALCVMWEGLTLTVLYTQTCSDTESALHQLSGIYVSLSHIHTKINLYSLLDNKSKHLDNKHYRAVTVQPCDGL